MNKTQENNDWLKFLHLEAENFKFLSKKVIDIGGRSMLIIGKNGTGKSSLIDAMLSPLDVKLRPSKPIKAGEERSTIQIVVGGEIGGEAKKYTLDLYFTPKNDSGRLVVTNEQGETIKTQATFVKSLIGNVSFDVMSFINMPKEKKIEMLKKLTGHGKEIDTINFQINEKKESKKYKKQRVDDLEAVLKNHGYTPEEVDKYSSPLPLGPLETKRSEVFKKQQSYDEVKSKMEGFEKAVPALEQAIGKSTNEVLRLKQLIAEEEVKITAAKDEIEKNKINIDKGNNWLKPATRPDVESINKEIQDAIVHNEHVTKLSSHADQQREMLKIKQELDAVAGEITTLEGQRNKIISKSQLPIPGLTFTDNDIFLNDIPLEEGGVNKSMLFDVGVDIAISLNPTLKAIFLHDASLFDKEHLMKIIKKAEAKGYQVICELVGENAEIDIKFTETELV